MARYVDANCKLCRRERQKLFLKGTKCLSAKCPVEKRNFPPGQHGQSRRTKISEYGVQLREKQKVRKIYGLNERQFRNYFEKAVRQKGITGQNLVKMLERRLDNTVYRLGLAPSRKAARQLILHKHFTVNGRSVNIPSFLMTPGDIIQVVQGSRTLELIHDSMKRIRGEQMLPWLSLDKANLSGTFLNVPERADVPLQANEQLIVELYSK
ncbi:MAG: 30S ribosomal protein S4 [Ignavibacteria bacterium]|jgi:small subunit ribosomal protein S4|nr:30S ribosomal protein S4 [Ignavibacteria bacterium]